jgi:hypothetical protein
MGSNRFKTVSKEEASYEVKKALLPFLIEAGTPVYIQRDGWELAVSTSIMGPPREFAEESWADLGTWWVTIEPKH